MSRRAAAALVVLAAVVAAAVLVPLLALGSSGKPRLSRDAYARSVTTVFANLGRQFHAAPAGAAPAETSASLASMKAALDRATARLRALEPPSDADRRHRVLVSATHDYARQVDLVRASVDLGDPVTIATHLRDVVAPDVIQRTIRSLNASGYRIPVTVVALH